MGMPACQLSELLHCLHVCPASLLVPPPLPCCRWWWRSIMCGGSTALFIYGELQGRHWKPQLGLLQSFRQQTLLDAHAPGLTPPSHHPQPFLQHTASTTGMRGPT